MEKKQGWDEFRKRLNEPPEMTDTLIRHKWPEEKPEHNREYLVYSVDEVCECGEFIRAVWKDWLTPDECFGPYGDIWSVDESGWFFYNDGMYFVTVDGVRFYWELPEVKE